MHEDRDESVVETSRIRWRRPAVGGRAVPGVFVAIALGGAIGNPARYGMTRVIHVSENTFPWATFVTNVTGAFVIGLFLTLALERFPPSRYARPFFAIGVLGAFTTFSTMAVETVMLCKDGHALLGIVYLCVSVTTGLVCCYLGIVLARLLPFGRAPEPL